MRSRKARLGHFPGHVRPPVNRVRASPAQADTQKASGMIKGKRTGLNCSIDQAMPDTVRHVGDRRV